MPEVTADRSGYVCAQDRNVNNSCGRWRSRVLGRALTGQGALLGRLRTNYAKRRWRNSSVV